MSVNLPAAVDNQSTVQLRILTTNATGNDEWVGIDDISITGFGCMALATVTNANDSGSGSLRDAITNICPGRNNQLRSDVKWTDNYFDQRRVGD